MNNRIKTAAKILLVAAVWAGGWYWQSAGMVVYASCSPSDPCPSGWTCIGYIDNPAPQQDTPGSCQQQGCFAGISCDPPLVCSGDICLPPGGGGGGGGWQYEGAYCSDFGLVQSCYNTKGYCTYKQQCVPLTSNKLVATTGCTKENPSYFKCQVNCGCCPAGSTWQCDRL
jgi:hypothetical protein